MSSQTLNTPCSGLTGPEAADPAVLLRAQAEAVWAEMRRRHVSPTPHNYELWFTYLGGGNTRLTQRMDGLLESGTPSAAALEALHGECIAGPGVKLDLVTRGAEAIEAAAQTLVEQVGASQAGIRSYGEELEGWARQLGQEPTGGGLMQAIAALTAETSRAAERTRVLEKQLSASTVRIMRMRRALADVKLEATTDSLTGIANRKAFETRMRQALARVRTEPGPVSVLLIDIDHFKQFNDTHGHKAGDLVLRLVGRVLADNVKGRDTAARYGGEEFAVLLAGADIRAATVVARQICEALGSKRLVNRSTDRGLGHITVSIGVAEHRPGESAPALVERADLALYRAKHAGRNRVCAE